jgi:hypothetical protein
MQRELHEERGREVIARRGDKASICPRGARAQQQWESRGGHASWALSIRRCWGGERDRGGGIQVSTRCIEGRQCTAPTRLCTCTQAVLRRALDGVLSVVSAQPAERAA